MSPLAIAEWIEISQAEGECRRVESPLAIAEWIEIGPEKGADKLV